MANLIYREIETAKWFVPATATQAEDAAFEVHSLAAGAGRQSAQLDLGVGSGPRRFNWRAFIQFATAPVVGEALRIYLKTSSGSHPDNDDGTTEGAVSAENKLKNLHFLGAIVVDEAVQDIEMVASGTFEIDARYVQVVFWNGTADGLTADVNENGFTMSPVADEIQ